MSEASPRLSLPYIQPSQNLKHVTHNEAVARLDAIVQLGVASRALSVPPPVPAEAARYIVASGASGAWAGQAGRVALWQDGAWTFVAPQTGWLAWVADEALIVACSGGGWIVPVGSLGDTVPQLGINMTADATNRLAVAAAATLLTHDGAGHQLKIDKAAAADTASLLFQTGFSGRAEMGLAGNNDFAIKVSADGATFRTAVAVDAGSGNTAMGDIAADAAHRLTLDGGLIVKKTSGMLDTTFEASDGYQVLNLQNCSSVASWHGAFFQSKRARGTATAPAAILANDGVFTFDMFGHDGTGFVRGAQQHFFCDAAPSAGIVPFGFVLRLMNPAGVLNEILRATSGGSVGIGVANPTTKLQVDGPVRPKSYTVTTLPSASASGAGATIYVSNASGGGVPAFSDGTAWRRCTDRTVVT